MCCVGSDLCEEVVTRLDESYRVSVCVCLIVCNIETSTMRRSGPDWDCYAIEKEIKLVVCHKGNKIGCVCLISRKYFELRRWKEGEQNCVTSSFVLRVARQTV